ncbi:MAG TPA: YbaK/EbsC family protein [Flexilinea sp.]|jgi:prolyl-tRNA editing enzyme YbaK/EbsC (Cys-tRNA(Pro) deacylase)|nr:MAG: Cys-tRNA(Pro)/Cys-tRNA(Cys) deacylase YbaK [Chloroflexi bacterium ADurb.Bin344]HNY95100.1 YbaK/EbsC family protein [Flexilinea sp.]HOU19978.1 YbaK/EbsC family protein [Flexilinea sp.]HPJ64635.1 YbaK/EbsC family protein [Flexilinea sp.]HPR70183.1 YbaK/EbsC family protein [Flexilinea sp.]
MSVENVKAYFDQYGISDRIREFEESSATVELAAGLLSCSPGEIAKTLAFRLNGGCVLIVAAGDAKVDNSKFKAVFGSKAVMVKPEEAEELVGHAVGGVCPFAVKEGVRVYLDQSLKRFETVYPAAGDSHSVIRLSIAELEKYSGAIGWIDVCKNWQ